MIIQIIPLIVSDIYGSIGTWQSVLTNNREEMNTTFERSSNSTDEWYTPKEIIDALGEFDLDPCAPLAPPL